MRITTTGHVLVLLIVGCTAAVHARSAGDDALERAKGLYASAAYDEALAVLDRMQTSPSGDDPTSVAEYRIFCLLALGRRDEARKNIDQILHANPQYRPSADQASPRIQSVFRDVRRDSLPKIVIERYAAAKAAFERKDPAASQQFDEVLALLDDPDLQASAALKDLREVAAAFRDLTKAIGASAAAAAAARQDGSPAAPQRPPAPPPVADIIYTSADSDVVPPVAQSQKMPPWRPARNEAVQEFRGALRLLIDQSGAVVSATIPASTRPAYDQLLLRAARDWKFQPARKDGAAVRYLKVIEIRLTSTPQ